MESKVKTSGKNCQKTEDESLIFDGTVTPVN